MSYVDSQLAAVTFKFHIVVITIDIVSKLWQQILYHIVVLKYGGGIYMSRMICAISNCIFFDFFECSPKKIEQTDR